jgi:hypothetical protein
MANTADAELLHSQFNAGLDGAERDAGFTGNLSMAESAIECHANYVTLRRRKRQSSSQTPTRYRNAQLPFGHH